MLPTKCFTCGRCLAGIELDWQEKYYSLDADKTLTEEEKANRLSKLLDELYVTDLCCRSLVLTYFKAIKIIVP